jgi:hypothetical protein
MSDNSRRYGVSTPDARMGEVFALDRLARDAGVEDIGRRRYSPRSRFGEFNAPPVGALPDAGAAAFGGVAGMAAYPERFQSAVAGWPASANIEDRRNQAPLTEEEIRQLTARRSLRELM